MKIVLRLLPLLLLAGLLWTPGTVRAEVAEVLREGRRLYLQGRKLARAGRLKAALVKYEAALGIFDRQLRETRGRKSSAFKSKRSTLLYVIGRTYQLLKKPTRAWRSLRECLAGKPKPAVRKMARRCLGEEFKKVRARLSLFAKPASASMVLTDAWGRKHRGRGKLRVEVGPGRYRLLMTAKGHRKKQVSFRVRARKNVVQRYDLESKSDKPDKSTPGAAKVVERSPGKRALVWTGAGLAAAGVVVTGIFAGKYVYDTGKVAELTSKSSVVYEYQEARDLDLVMMAVGGSVALAASITSVVLFVKSRKKEGKGDKKGGKAGKTSLRLLPTPRGLVLSGRF